MKNIFIASDHAGFALKQFLLQDINVEMHDCGTYNEESCDFPDFAYQVVQKIKKNENSMGIVICKTGIGISMLANRFTWVRAALCFSMESAILTRQHNNANVLCLGSIYHENPDEYKKIVECFLQTDFLGGKYQKRIDLINRYCK